VISGPCPKVALIEVGGLMVAYRRTGSGLRLVLLHAARPPGDHHARRRALADAPSAGARPVLAVGAIDGTGKVAAKRS
jgi:hypothetical protein